MARQSAKDRMRAEGVAKEKGEADMEEFIKDRDVRVQGDTSGCAKTSH